MKGRDGGRFFHEGIGENLKEFHAGNKFLRLFSDGSQGFVMHQLYHQAISQWNDVHAKLFLRNILCL